LERAQTNRPIGRVPVTKKRSRTSSLLAATKSPY
jgi:hypothetical protein